MYFCKWSSFTNDFVFFQVKFDVSKASRYVIYFLILTNHDRDKKLYKNGIVWKNTYCLLVDVGMSFLSPCFDI